MAKENANTWSNTIEKCMYWHTTHGWTTYGADNQETCLRRNYDQLLITSGVNIFESFNIHLTKIKGYSKNGVIVLIILSNDASIRKIRFKLPPDNVTIITNNLSSCIPFVINDRAAPPPLFRNLNEVFKETLTKNVVGGTSFLDVGDSFESLMKLCLMDPQFHHLVNETEKYLKNNISLEK